MRLFSKWRVLLQCSSAGMVRYTPKARLVVFRACEQAIREKSTVVTPEHLLVGLLRVDHALAARVGLPTMDAVPQGLTNISERQQVAAHLALSEAARQVISLAAEERTHLTHKHTGTEHLLLGIIRSGSDAARILEHRGLSVDRIRHLIGNQKLTAGWERLALVMS